MKTIVYVGIVMGFLLLGSGALHAHCDSLDGPVVKDASLALQKKDATPVLKWVKQEDEGAVRESFNHTLSMLSSHPESEQMYKEKFFTDVVRLHREGEGEAFEGKLKPEGEIDPIIKVADKAIASGSSQELIKMLAKGLEDKFDRVKGLFKTKDDSVEEGREYVAAYVDFMHYVERLNEFFTENTEGGHRHHE